MIDFQKTNPSCSNVYLLDERLCVGNSLDTINTNFSNLFDAVSSIKNFNNSWDNLYTLAVAQSANWYRAAANIETYGKQWLDTCLVVQSLSSTWSRHFSVFYNKMIEDSDWYSLTDTQQDDLIMPWLNTHFDPSRGFLRQTINVVIYLKNTKSVSMNFDSAYQETCSPNGGGGVITCGGCPRPHRGCNHHGGRAGYGPCTNAYAACGASTTAGSVSHSCVGRGGRTLSLTTGAAAPENVTSRVIEIEYKNTGNQWSRV